MFYSWLFTGIATVNKESFLKIPGSADCDSDPETLDPDRDSECHQNPIGPLATPTPTPPKDFMKIR